MRLYLLASPLRFELRPQGFGGPHATVTPERYIIGLGEEITLHIST